MKKIYRRVKYMSQILAFLGKPVIKVLIGQRRVGKSMLLLDLQEVLLSERGYKVDEILYINKELEMRSSIQNSQHLLACVQKHHRVVIVDEIQDISEREKAVRDLIASGTIDIYITGSNANLLSGELATLLSGRYISLYIYPFDFQEFCNCYELVSGQAALSKYLSFGGMPSLYHMGMDEFGTMHLKDVYNTIVLKDIIQRYRIRNASLFMSLLQYISRQVGSIFSAKSISDFLLKDKIKMEPSTILEYLYFAKSACIIYDIQRYDIKGKRLFEIKHKRFFTDIGMRNIIAGTNSIHPTDIPGVIENCVVSNLRSFGRSLLVGEYDDYEIDIIAERGSQKMYIQVATTILNQDTLEREQRSLSLINDNRPKYILLYDTKGLQLQAMDGIQVQSIHEFLLLLGLSNNYER